MLELADLAFYGSLLLDPRHIETGFASKTIRLSPELYGSIPLSWSADIPAGIL